MTSATIARWIALGVSSAVLGLTGCSADAPPGTGPSSVRPSASAGSAPSSGSPSASPTGPPTPTPTTGTPSPTATGGSTSAEQPVPKVGRPGASTPTVEAKPAEIDEPVRYPDGLSLQVRSVEFAEETDKGPGGFPGREYAVLTLEIKNRSKKTLSMETVVVTVLDRNDQPVPPVNVEKAKASDFAGSLKPSKIVSARYAFAVPRSSRSKVTVVVDFDGVHTSAVFRGRLR